MYVEMTYAYSTLAFHCVRVVLKLQAVTLKDSLKDKEIHGTELAISNAKYICARMHKKASLSWKISPDFKEDFEISSKISRFQARFRDFKQDFGISSKISGFRRRFRDFKRFQRFRRDFKGSVRDFAKWRTPRLKRSAIFLRKALMSIIGRAEQVSVLSGVHSHILYTYFSVVL